MTRFVGLASLTLLTALGCSGKLDLGHDVQSGVTGNNPKITPDAGDGDAATIPVISAVPTPATCVGIPCFRGPINDVATSTGAAKGLTMDVDNVFWAATAGDAVMITPRDGSMTMGVETANGGPFRVAENDTTVFFTSADGGYVASFPKTSRATHAPKIPILVTVLVSGEPQPESLLVADEGIYFADQLAGTLKLSALDGSSVKTLVTGLSTGVELALDDRAVYYVDSGAGEIHALDRTTGVNTLLASGREHPVAPALRGDQLFFLELGTEAMDYNDGRLLRMPSAGGTVDVLLDNLDAPNGLAADTAGIYLCTRGTTENGFKGKIVRLGDDGEVATLAVGQAEPFAIAVDGDAVFWTTDADNTLHSIDR